MTDTGADYFESMYRDDPDPWGFDRRWYERRKYALTIAALPEPRYRRALEAGCANGALTELLADRCDELYAFDLVEAAASRAAKRLLPHEHVHVLHGRFPDYWPSGHGDLVVWSEIAYYLSAESADLAITGLERWLEESGTLIAVHYTGATNYARPGTDIGPWLDGVSFLERLTTLEDEQFELGVWRRIPDVSPSPGLYVRGG